MELLKCMIYITFLHVSTNDLSRDLIEDILSPLCNLRSYILCICFEKKSYMLDIVYVVHVLTYVLFCKTNVTLCKNCDGS